MKMAYVLENGLESVSFAGVDFHVKFGWMYSNLFL